MKWLSFFSLFIFLNALHAQKGQADDNVNVSDPFEMNLTASIKNVIRLARDTKKEEVFFTKELIKVSNEGEPTYTAAFPMPGFDAHITKGRTDRKKGLTYWSWSTRFIEAPKGEKAMEIEAVAAKADSIVKRFQSYATPDKVHDVAYLHISKFVNSNYEKSDYAALTISFAKPVYQTEQQAYDSLVSLYKPLLTDPATARPATSQLCYALVHEGFTESKAVSAIRELLPGIASQNINAAYAVCMGFPYFVKYDQIKDVLDSQQQERLKNMARQFINDWESEWQKKYGKQDRVALQQNKAVVDKITKACAGYGAETSVKPEMLVKGVTVAGQVNNKLVVGRLGDIDCTKGIVYITEPGYVNVFNSGKTVQVSLTHYRHYWKKHSEQYYSCTRCGGAGGDYVTETESKTKELPFGFFEGIQTTSTRTTTKRYMRYCSKCKGTGLALEKERTL
ncbi:MAG: hypothetical protein QM781_17955 [Chitinophagaceae bacterium]